MRELSRPFNHLHQVPGGKPREAKGVLLHLGHLNLMFFKSRVQRQTQGGKHRQEDQQDQPAAKA